MIGQALNMGVYLKAVQERIRSLEDERVGLRLWRKDPSLWKEDPQNQQIIRKALGWLNVAEWMEENLDDLRKWTAEIRAAGFRHVVHMGMGGSSLAPLTFRGFFSQGADALPLTVLDTTDPATVLKIARGIPLGETLFINASKSGTTAEPVAFGEYFYAKVKEIKGHRAEENFVAITDPGTPLAKMAEERGFRRIVPGCEDIGGRYSALSPFGLVPAALMGFDLRELLARASHMMRACGSGVAVRENPGVVLGAALGELALQSRDKLTLILPDLLSPLGLWLEQLLAESTGKEGKGILPVAGEPLGIPSKYGKDRLFVHFRLLSAADETLEKFIKELLQAGQPVITIELEDHLDLAQEFFRWEVATAIAGAILKVNPFDQPNVQESKDNTNRLLALFRQDGKLPEVPAAFREGPLSFYTAQKAPAAPALLKIFFEQARPGDYLALQAYLPEDPPTSESLQSLRKQLGNRLNLATTLGFGPRFLHSTGQFHKGGPNTGLFLQLIADDAEDAPIPGAPYTFGLLKQAQALGDWEALQKHGRRILRVHLGEDVLRGLELLSQMIQKAQE
jgi:glucose-6-phosphate isomerase